MTRTRIGGAVAIVLAAALALVPSAPTAAATIDSFLTLDSSAPRGGSIGFSLAVSATTVEPHRVTIDHDPLASGQSWELPVSATQTGGVSTCASSTTTTVDCTWTPAAVGDTLTVVPRLALAADASLGVWLATADVTWGGSSELRTVDYGVENVPPTLTPIADQTVFGGAPTTLIATATDVEGDALTFAITDGPAWATATPSGVITLAPAVSDASSTPYPIVVMVTDEWGASAGIVVSIRVRDSEAPVLTVPADLTVEATGPAGALVNYVAVATDATDGSIDPSCTPPSGSTFIIGTTTVDCIAVDQDGRGDDARFRISVWDRTAPAVTRPDGAQLRDITVGGAVRGMSPEPITFEARADDIVDGPLPVSCLPASGNRFAIGATRVTCTATDAAGNTGSSDFWVIVTTAALPGTTAAGAELAATGSSVGSLWPMGVLAVVAGIGMFVVRRSRSPAA